MSEPKSRRFDEGVLGSVLIIWLNLSVMFSTLLRGRSRIRESLEELGLIEEWAIGYAIAAGGIALSLAIRNRTLRYGALAVNACVNLATVLVAINIGFAFSHFMLSTLGAALFSFALIWIDERAYAKAYHRLRREGVSEGRHAFH